MEVSSSREWNCIFQMLNLMIERVFVCRRLLRFVQFMAWLADRIDNVAIVN